jgi:hypothetical protein
VLCDDKLSHVKIIDAARTNCIDTHLSDVVYKTRGPRVRERLSGVGANPESAARRASGRIAIERHCYHD